MFKDRRVLMEQEMVKQKQACGLLYKTIVTGRATDHEHQMYDSMKMRLMDSIAELAVVDQMIADGHE